PARIGLRPSFVVGGVILLACEAVVGWLAPESTDTTRRADQRPGVPRRELVTVGLIVLSANIHVFFLPAMLPQILPAFGVGPEATLEVGGILVFASGVAAALGAVL